MIFVEIRNRIHVQCLQFSVRGVVDIPWVRQQRHYAEMKVRGSIDGVAGIAHRADNRVVGYDG